MVIGAISSGAQYLWQRVKSIPSKVAGAFSSKAKVNKLALHESDDKGEKCGVFGIFSDKRFKIGDSLFSGMTAIQNRGQDASGFIYSHGDELSEVQHKVRNKKTKKGGLVADLFQTGKEEEYCYGKFGIGHTLYATSRDKDGTLKPHPIVMGEDDNKIALVHNGNIPDVTSLKNFLASQGHRAEELDQLNDSGLITKTIHHFYKETHDLKSAITKAKEYFVGTYALIVVDKNEMAVLRDPVGNKPLNLGRDKDGRILVCSETHAFDALGGHNIREIKPGELLILSTSNIKKDLSKIPPDIIFEKTQNKQDQFEDFYNKKPQSLSRDTKYVYEVRRDSGKLLKDQFEKYHPNTKIDLVVPVPESGIPAATGFAEAMEVPVNPALIKNFHTRTFMNNGRDIRQKFTLVKNAIKGKRIAVVDDSIVKGNTSRELVKYLREAQPALIHFLAASPPISHPSFYGVDIAEQNKLIAYEYKNSLKSIARSIGADTVTYLSKANLANAIEVPEEDIDFSITDGNYVVPIGKKVKDVDFFLKRKDHLQINA